MLKPRPSSFFRIYILGTLLGIVFSIAVSFMLIPRIIRGGGGPEKNQEIQAVLSRAQQSLDSKDFQLIEMVMNGPERDTPKAFAVIIFALLISYLISILFLIRYMRAKAAVAENVMKQIESGNLDVRFPKDKFDDFARLMGSFDKMADQIKSLVLKLRNVDQTRKEMLQEISHDLRTPLASLTLSLESLEKKKNISEEKRAALINESQDELRYITNLLEDLLFLSVVEEPGFVIHKSMFDLSEMLEDTLKSIQIRYPSLKIEFQAAEPHVINADPILIKRAIRNLLENSASFTKESLKVLLSDNTLEILDDGPGFKEEVLKNFGKKRLNTARVTDEVGERKSTGLGAVIAERILSHHQMQLTASNKTNSSNSVVGASVQINLS